jgi:hypothetical protein
VNTQILFHEKADTKKMNSAAQRDSFPEDTISPLHLIKGYDLKLSGRPLLILEDQPPPTQVAAVASLPVFFTSYSIARWEGALFSGCYAAYTAYLIMDATGQDTLPAFSHVMLTFVLPLLTVTILAIALRSLKRQTDRYTKSSKQEPMKKRSSLRRPIEPDCFFHKVISRRQG